MGLRQALTGACAGAFITLDSRGKAGRAVALYCSKKGWKGWKSWKAGRIVLDSCRKAGRY
eukprot:12269200-Heterocapsa_arctica.AAC.1